MSFPEKNILGFTKGWKKLGSVCPVTEYSKKINKNMVYSELHSFCKHKLCIGEENGEVFRYCPVCMIKVDFNYEKNKN